MQLSHQNSESAKLCLDDLLPALAFLDDRLKQAVKVAQDLYSSDTSDDLYRGLYVSEDQVIGELKRMPGAPLFAVNSSHSCDMPSQMLRCSSRLIWLQQTYNLTPFDINILLLALAPELDRRYERVYAYLQDHVGRRWPTVDLALSLFSTNAVERMQRRVHFDADAPLLKNGLLYLVPEPEQAINSLLTHAFKLDKQITRFLLYQDSLDERIAPFCTLVIEAVPPDGGRLKVTVALTLPALLLQTRQACRPFRL
jgi:hypothetical protein